MIFRKFGFEVDFGDAGTEEDVQTFAGHLDREEFLGLMLHSLQQGAIESIKFKGLPVSAHLFEDTSGAAVNHDTLLQVTIPYGMLERIT